MPGSGSGSWRTSSMASILFVHEYRRGGLIPDPVTAFFAQVFLNATYTIGFWIGQGATPGKMAVGVKVVMANGHPIEFGAACLRYVGYIACALTLGIGYLMIAFTAEKRGLHDFIGRHGRHQEPLDGSPNFASASACTTRYTSASGRPVASADSPARLVFRRDARRLARRVASP